ncbi:hypothetical protein FKM82_017914 [Ascaphus truei]
MQKPPPAVLARIDAEAHSCAALFSHRRARPLTRLVLLRPSAPRTPTHCIAHHFLSHCYASSLHTQALSTPPRTPRLSMLLTLTHWIPVLTLALPPARSHARPLRPLLLADFCTHGHEVIYVQILFALIVISYSGQTHNGSDCV